MTNENKVMTETDIETVVRKKPGRPPKPKILSADDLKRKRAMETRSANRARRALLGGYEGQRMLAAPHEGFHLHWINDVGTNLQEMLAKGYSFVEDDSSIESDDLGRRNSLQVSKNGPPITAYLMEIPEDMYLEDQLQKERSIQDVEDQIRRADVGRGLGSERTSSGDNVVYNPSESGNQLLD